LKEYYKEKGVDLNHVVQIGKDRHNLPDYLVFEGANLLYLLVKNGLKVSDVSIIHTILSQAKVLKRIEKDIGLGGFNDRMKNIEETLREINDKMNKSFWFRFKEIIFKKRYIRLTNEN